MMCNGPGILCITTLLESALFGASRLSVLLGCQTKAWMRAYRETDEAAFLSLFQWHKRLKLGRVSNGK